LAKVTLQSIAVVCQRPDQLGLFDNDFSSDVDSTCNNFATRFLSSSSSLLERFNPIGKIVPSAKFGLEEVRTSGTAILFLKSPAKK